MGINRSGTADERDVAITFYTVSFLRYWAVGEISTDSLPIEPFSWLTAITLLALTPVAMI